MPTVDVDLPSGSDPEEFSARVFGAPGPRGGAGGLELAPFRGVRFDPRVVGDPSAVTSPPYDLIDAAAVRRLEESDAHNIVRLIAPRADYAEASATLRRWLEQGALAPDGAPALYVYEAAAGGRVLQRGLVGALGLRAESAGVVLPHENVYPGPVRDRLALMTATGANLEPIFLIYEGDGDASDLADRAAAGPPLTEVRAGDGLVHRLWAITDPAALARIAADLAPRRALIADGHHRYATYRVMQAGHAEAGPWDRGLALLVDSTRYPPHLGAIHRVLPGLDPAEALERAAPVFRVAEHAALDTALPALRAADGPAFLLGGGAGLHLLTDPDPARLGAAMAGAGSARLRALDTAVLDRLLVNGLWRVAEDERSVEVVHDDPAAALARAREAGGTAVVLNPLRVADVLAIAAGGERVPRKSTSFGPKPRTGLVLRLL
ncbi:DUF1015 family protein [Actinomadura parmotrematis]|uniref:DUF1015 domain-containing protein n=1 Tax=Actinomadura parmotrematis TaxID=2864039 RepID=A0ABS7FRZ0_9ACTN|nr:DUF1015 domain-containing protein [Actinomadura parmotrematis]MBW8483170.1 DUF1015 domain-containing protein [Actinomadura parmotrematis]